MDGSHQEYPALLVSLDRFSQFGVLTAFVALVVSRTGHCSSGGQDTGSWEGQPGCRGLALGMRLTSSIGKILNIGQERRRVEAAYAQGLKRLASRRPQNVDLLG